MRFPKWWTDFLERLDEIDEQFWLKDDPKVEPELLARAEQLKKLEHGWDGYKGEPIDHPTLDKAVDIATALAPLFSDYEPQLVPGSNGTVTIEFHTGGFNVECWVNNANT